MYITVVGDWSVETTHDIDPESVDYEAACADAVQPTIDFATAWGSDNHGGSFEEPAGTEHVVVVRKIEA
jgi:hypothetical protein